MASPQVESGFIRIANELLEALAKAKLSGIQNGIVNTVIRQTYGYNRKEAVISDGFIANAIESTRKSVNREMQALINKKIIIVVKESTYTTPRTIKLNKNYEEWGQNCGQATKLGIPQNVPTCSPEIEDRVAPKLGLSSPEIEDKGSPEIVAQINTYIKDNNKNNIKDNKKTKEHKHKFGEFGHVLLTDAEMNNLLNDFDNGIFTEYVRRLDEYIEMKGAKYKNHSLVIRNWIRRDNEKGIENNKTTEQKTNDYNSIVNEMLEKERAKNGQYGNYEFEQFTE